MSFRDEPRDAATEATAPPAGRSSHPAGAGSLAASSSDAGQRHGPARVLRASDLDTEPVTAAGRLLGALLADAPRLSDARIVVRIAEVEAYGPDDPASHAVRGPTARCASMFAPPGTAYVYRSYGVHWCLNVSVGAEGVGAAVLLRAAVVLKGQRSIQRLRPRASQVALLRGPGCLTEGLAIGGDLDGAPLLAPTGRWRLFRDGFIGDRRDGPRVGVTRASERPWRLFLAGRPEISRYRRSPRAEDRTSA